MMTRKHFQKLADIARQLPGPDGDWLSEQLADMAAEENPRFDRDRFMVACGRPAPTPAR